MQRELYKTIIKTFKKIEINATGNLVKTIEKQNGEKKHICAIRNPHNIRGILILKVPTFKDVEESMEKFSAQRTNMKIAGSSPASEAFFFP